MNKQKAKQTKMASRHKKIRYKIIGTALRPRLSVYRSNAGMNLQLIDDESGKTLASANSSEVKDGKKTKVETALALGKLLAEKASAQKISVVVFDRGGYRYHGRVKAVADGARAGGLQF